MRIILADHHPQSRWAVKMLIEENPEFDLVGEAVDAQGLQMLAEMYPADLVLIDRDLPGEQIGTIIAQLRELERPPVILVLSSEDDYDQTLVNAGANAVISKGDGPDWLVEKLNEYAVEIDHSAGTEGT